MSEKSKKIVRIITILLCVGVIALLIISHVAFANSIYGVYDWAEDPLTETLLYLIAPVFLMYAIPAMLTILLVIFLKKDALSIIASIALIVAPAAFFIDYLVWYGPINYRFFFELFSKETVALCILIVVNLLNIIIHSMEIRKKNEPIRKQKEEDRKEKRATETNTLPSRSKVVAAILAFFLGATGAHRYYLGYKKEGAIQTFGLLCDIVGSTLYVSNIYTYSQYPARALPAALLLLVGAATGIWAFVDFIRILTGSLKPADGSEYTDGRVVVQTAPAAPSASDNVDALEKLAKLHEQGILNDEEFSAKKADILAKM